MDWIKKNQKLFIIVCIITVVFSGAGAFYYLGKAIAVEGSTINAGEVL